MTKNIEERRLGGDSDKLRILRILKQKKKYNVQTLPKAQQIRGMSSACKSYLFRSYHEFKHKS